MWTEAKRVALARIEENDRIAATAVARRYLPGPTKAILEPVSDWEWVAAAGLGAWLYRRRRVSARPQLARVMTGLENEARAASIDRVPADEWALRMAGIATASALVAGAFAVGGWARVGIAQADIEAHLLSELGYLDGFADDLAAGRIPRDGRFVRRAMLYGAAGWGLYMALRGREARRRGYDEERSNLDPGAEHCAGCVAEADKGWQPIGSLVPIGDRQCRSNCRCHLQYRNRAGEVAE